MAAEEEAVDLAEVDEVIFILFFIEKFSSSVICYSGGGGGGRGGFGGRGNFDQGPPERVIPFGYFDYPCQDELILKVEIEDVPYFNAPIYLENKSQIGKVDEIFGNLKDYFVSVKLDQNMKVNSLTPKQKVDQKDLSLDFV